MALEQKLSLKLAQKLVMTPSLQQAIKLLQMTRMELDTLLTQELVENPVLEEAAESADTTDPEEEAALELVRGMDPPGIACRDLRESLLRQMDARGVPADALARRVVEEAWDLFLRRQFPAVAKKLGIELAALEEAVELIRSLETNPGRKFSTERPHYIEPDVFVRRVGD